MTDLSVLPLSNGFNLGNAYPKATPKYGIDDIIDFLDNIYDVVFMTYEANVAAYGAILHMLHKFHAKCYI